MALRPSPASIRLTDLIRDREVLRQIAFACRVTEQSVKYWSSGQNRPIYKHRVLLEKRFKIRAEWWDEDVSPTESQAA